ncbi:hypothetical protein L210DRAFT_943394 [Boletus edulis BED1]|uniref:Proline-rich protein n=1 Tax=Boletus edulis BED1 TaxID=1328754 RepID=A0AAD4C5Q9_BOLED|nr:hypothetical protein L210DRAFT_943394 [Boletus edulis BED1]
MSSKNPFRQVEQPLPPLPQRTPSPELPALPPPSPIQSDMPSSSRTIPPDSSARREIENIGDDLPPPYTPAATIGEETVGLGPRRPFQRPPLLPPSSFHPPPDQRPRSNWPLPPPGSGFYAQPDPRGLAPWQTQSQYRQRQKTGGGLIGALFDTVRDIADVVSGAHDERMLAAQNANAGAYAVPYPGNINTHPVYAPPPGPPGQVLQPPPPPPRPVSAPPHSPPTVPDDGSPTRTPVPGHPLLRDGNLLVYPRDHLCVKCKNTGYKNYDPSNPCRKCWDKYGRQYTGVLTYTPWSPSGNDPRMQRPLPRFVPPHLAGSHQGSSQSIQHLHHSRSISQPHNMQSADSGPSYYVINPLCPRDAPPVPHAVPVDPGDPRLGGRLCMRCDGAGIRTVHDVMTCDNCGGTGRIWT